MTGIQGLGFQHLYFTPSLQIFQTIPAPVFHTLSPNFPNYLQLTAFSSSQPWKASCKTACPFLLMGWDKMRERTTKATGPIAQGPAPAPGVHSILKAKIHPHVDKSTWTHTTPQTALPGKTEQANEQMYFIFLLRLHHTACATFSLVQSQLCLTLCNPMNCRMPGFPVHHQLPELAQTHVHQVSDAIQTSHPLSSPSPPAPNRSQHQGLFQWVNSLHEVAKVLEFQLQHQSFQWTPRTDLL